MWSQLTNRVTVRRATAYVLDRTSAASTLSWTRQPVRESIIELRVWPDGTSGTGSVTLTGTVGGVADTETIVSTGPGFYRSARAWTALTLVTTTGLADELAIPTLEAQAVGRDGSRQETHYTVVTGWPAAIQPGGPGGSLKLGGTWPNQQVAGRYQQAVANITIAYDETWAPRNGDLIDDDHGLTWQVVGYPLIAGTASVRAWKCNAQEYMVVR